MAGAFYYGADPINASFLFGKVVTVFCLLPYEMYGDFEQKFTSKSPPDRPSTLS